VSSSPCRVLIVAPWGERAGGAEQMLWTILRHLDRSKIDPEVVFLSAGPFADEVSSLGIEAWALPSGRLRELKTYVRTVMRLAERIRRGNFDVVLAWSAKAQLYLGVANVLARRRLPALWWQHAIATGHWIDRLATLVPAAAVGCSSSACAQAQLRLRPRRRTFVVYPGVDSDGGTGPGVTRTALGIADDAWVVGSVGRLQPWKGHDRVIAAVAHLRDRGIPAVGLIVGGESFGLSPGYEERLRRLADELEIGRNVVFTSEVADARRYYPLMDVFVNASDEEPFGISVVEAMIAGCPVVAFARGGPAEIVEDGVSGVLVGNDGELVEALATLAESKQLGQRIAAAGSSRVALLFRSTRSASNFADELIATVASAAKDEPALTKRGMVPRRNK
jgi:glycosyltransferase involved in cell wall biosynthesis